MAVDHPDFIKNTFPGRTTILTSQTQLVYLSSVDVAGSTSSNFDVYTVPAGKRLYLHFIKVTCTRSNINQFLFIYGAASQYFYVDFDIHGEVNFPTDAAWIFPPGAVIDLWAINNDISTTRFHYSFFGTLVDI